VVASEVIIENDKNNDVLKVVDNHDHDNMVLDDNIFDPYSSPKKKIFLILINEISLYSFPLYPRRK